MNVTKEDDVILIKEMKPKRILLHLFVQQVEHCKWETMERSTTHTGPLCSITLERWLWPEDWASLACRGDFPIPCPPWRWSLICWLYFYLPYTSALGSSPSVGSSCPSAEVETALASWQLQLEAFPLGNRLTVCPLSVRLSARLPSSS